MLTFRTVKDTLTFEGAGPQWTDALDAFGRIELLKSCEVFGALEVPALSELARRVRLLHVAQGETLLGQGDLSLSMYVVGSGRLSVRAKGPLGADTELEVLERSAFFGEGALVEGSRSPMSVVGLVPSAVLEVQADALRDVLWRHPVVASALIPILARRLGLQRAHRRSSYPGPSRSAS